MAAKEDKERIQLESDWLIAEFQVLSGALLALLLSTFLATILGQIGASGYVLMLAAGEVFLDVWVYYRSRSAKLRKRINRTSDEKGVV